ncbi:MAG: glycosyltransferase [Crocinitomicaceae bacterium]|nr:glycosyltransferase [Crocinitomicaceae bacterium]
MSKIDFSIIVPVYRSVQTLEPLFGGIKSVMDEMKASFEVVFVEDSGEDDSWKELLRLKQLHADTIACIRLSRNFGQNGATLCGVDEAKGKRVITIDDDLQTDPADIKTLVDFQNETGADVVYGKYPEVKSSWLRRAGSKFVKRMFSKSQGGSSIGSSFRLLDEHIVDRIRFHSQDHLFINQVIGWYTLNAQFVEVSHNPRNEGKSGYSIWKLMLLSFRLIIYYTSVPLKIMVMLCILTAISIIGMTIYYVYFQLETGSTIDVFMIAVLAAMAIIAASIAVFGIYINRIYSSRVKKPNYAIKVKI